MNHQVEKQFLRVTSGLSEYGENWHKGGMREKKQNVFDDFISAAEFLVKGNYTSPKKLAIFGASNGGLLVAACAQQRPDLYGAVIGSVGSISFINSRLFSVLDMLRFHKFTAGAYWISEYGNPDDADDFGFIYKYSPLHNIRYPEAGQWPSTLMLTSDHDDRVVPSHTLKYAATLYETVKNHPKQTNPILFRIEKKAGHGAGKPMGKVINESVDKYSFLQMVLNMQWNSSEEDYKRHMMNSTSGVESSDVFVSSRVMSSSMLRGDVRIH
ncbi:peptidase, S9A/B/C family, catalytic domain protein [Oesophagostomum dentatum]|uniref:Prolyl endopeptidase n=1 Tax=Oesophagostomum dentatum TaxID=61180 RepID=A0A0B1TJK8_OESDE|nr:peptidase, S9A/B/C family, catalytic domain protein [Oesophagostomum dentatum]